MSTIIIERQLSIQRHIKVSKNGVLISKANAYHPYIALIYSFNTVMKAADDTSMIKQLIPSLEYTKNDDEFYKDINNAIVNTSNESHDIKLSTLHPIMQHSSDDSSYYIQLGLQLTLLKETKDVLIPSINELSMQLNVLKERYKDYTKISRTHFRKYICLFIIYIYLLSLK